MKVGDVMTQEVISVTPETHVADAAKLMVSEHISGLPVITSSGALVGVVTEGDFLRRTEFGTERRRPRWLEFLLGVGTIANDYVLSHSQRVADVMTRGVVVATEEMLLDTAVHLMESKRVKLLPVLRDGKVVGILSRANLLHALASCVPSDRATSDVEISKALQSAIEKLRWVPRQFHFVVKDGVVDLWGIITYDQQRQALRVAAENIPGVRRVRDHLLWFEPHTGVIVESGPDDRTTLH